MQLSETPHWHPCHVFSLRRRLHAPCRRTVTCRGPDLGGSAQKRHPCRSWGSAPNPDVLPGRSAADTPPSVVVFRPTANLPVNSVKRMAVGPATRTMNVACFVCNAIGFAIAIDPYGLYFCATHAAQVREQLALTRRLGYCPN